MTCRSLERALWALAVIAAIGAVVGWRSVGERAVMPADARVAPAGDPSRVSEDSLALAAERAFERDPFRVSRRPSSVPYTMVLESAPAVPQSPSLPKPVLAVIGIVGGPPWRALIEGMPGREGSVLVHAGDTVAQLRIRRVTRDTVVVSGHDTTWHLTLRRQWH